MGDFGNKTVALLPGGTSHQTINGALGPLVFAAQGSNPAGDHACRQT